MSARYREREVVRRHTAPTRGAYGNLATGDQLNTLTYSVRIVYA